MSPYIDNLISEAEKAALEGHLADCESCRTELTELRALVDTLRQLGDMKAPVGFMDELHLRLMQEKTVPFVRKETIRHRAGWIAASVAGIALTLGIGISSMVPPQMVANFTDKLPAIIWHDQSNQTEVDKIIQDYQTKSQVAKNDTTPGSTTTPGNKVGTAPNVKTPDTTAPGTTDVADNTKTPGTPTKIASNTGGNTPAAGAKSVDSVNLQLQVKDTGSVSASILQIAALNKGTTESYTPQTMAGKDTGVTVWVPEAKAAQVVAQLQKLGSATSPVKGTQDLSGDYQKIQNRLAVVNSEIDRLSAKENLTENEAEKLNVMKFEKNYLTSQREGLDNKVEQGLVGIHIVITEDGNR